MPTKAEINACPESVRRWYRSIGSKGGQAGKGTEKRRTVARKAAKKRWSAIRANGGVSWSQPDRPKKKRPQAKLPKRMVPIPKLPRPDSELGHHPLIGFQ